MTRLDRAGVVVISRGLCRTEERIAQRIVDVAQH